MFHRLLLIALLCLGVTNPGLAAPDAGYLEAAQAFEERIASATNDGKMPRLEDEQVAELIAVLSDSSRFIANATYRTENLGDLMAMCDKANRLVMAYVLFDLKTHVDRKAAPTQIARQVNLLMARNTVAFQNELALLQPFSLRCLARTIPLLTDFVAALPPGEFTPTRRAGLQQARNGILETYYGLLYTANAPQLDDSYRTRIFEVLAETAAPYASTLPPRTRQGIVAQAQAVQQDVPAKLQPHLSTIIDAMSQPECTGLCKL